MAKTRYGPKISSDDYHQKPSKRRVVIGSGSSSSNKTSVNEAEHGELTTAVPKVLYDDCQKAVAIMKHLETNKNDENSKLKLDRLQSLIGAATDYYASSKDIPRDWKFDPTTAHTLVPKSLNSDVKPRCSSRKAHGCPPPLRNKRRVFHAFKFPLKGHDMDIWKDFINSVDKNIPVLESISCNDFENLKVPLIHPIVQVIGQFAISAFNKSCHMYYKKDVQENLQDMQIMECKYIKTYTYFFYLSLEAVEEGKLGVYETKVIIDHRDGDMTLGRFVLTKRKPAGKRSGKHYGTSNPDDWLDPEEDFYAGLMCRDEEDLSLGFDYCCPFGSSGL